VGDGILFHFPLSGGRGQEPRIEMLPEKKLIGKRMTMSFADNKTLQLWSSFMPRRKEIQNSVGADLFSMQIYSPSFYNPFNEYALFEKWAAMEVSDFNNIPVGMESFTLPGGLYAIFLYRGDAREASPFFQYILYTWLPGSAYVLDDRPHFEILGEKYKRDDPSSEEEIWIPIKNKE
jgi:AraC family transcriptional regulator